MHRIFIAINLPENVKKKLMNHYDDWPTLPVKWTKKDNLHVTLLFLGNCSNDEVVEICRKTEEIAKGRDPFNIRLKKISFGPLKKSPRMVWALGGESKELGDLQKELEKSLEGVDSGKRTFAPHITMARLKFWEWSKLEPEERPEVDRDIDLGFEVCSIEVMDSILKRGGPEYCVLASCPFVDDI